MSNPGMKVYCNPPRPDDALVAKLKDCRTALLSDASNRMFAMDARIAARGSARRVCGPAVTVRSAVADNMAFHQAMLLAKPGDVIVADLGGDMSYSVAGALMYTCAKARGIAGFVLDGCVRYIRELEQNQFPVFAAGVNPRGHYQCGPGEVNVPVQCGGVVVRPGDIIVGDEDGVVVVRPEDVDSIMENMQRVIANEAEMTALIEAGKWEESLIIRRMRKNMEDMKFEFIE